MPWSCSSMQFSWCRWQMPPLSHSGESCFKAHLLQITSDYVNTTDALHPPWIHQLHLHFFHDFFFFFLFNSFSHWTLPPVIQSLPPSWLGSSWRRNVQSGTVFSLFLPSPESSSLPDRHFSSARMFMALRATTRTTSRGLLLHLEVIWFIQTFTLSILLRILFALMVKLTMATRGTEPHLDERVECKMNGGQMDMW